MDWPLVIITSFNMAIDASVTNACNAVRTGLKKWGLLLLAAFLFGLFQAAMPTIGYFVGYAFREVLETYIPYIAFALLTLLAIKSFVDFIKELRSSEEERGGELRFREILFQAVATSIDWVRFARLDLIPSFEAVRGADIRSRFLWDWA